jgi:tetratricopeptide (TPR) repeat protein
LYDAEGRYTDAEPLLERSLAIYEKVFGPDHPYVVAALNGLASLYDAEGRYSDAEPLLKRSLTTREKVLGPDHPDVVASLNDLAEVYRKLARYTDAEPLQKRSLAIRENALGPDHPDFATSLNNLALVYFAPRSLCRRRTALQTLTGNSRKRFWPRRSQCSGPTKQLSGALPCSRSLC